MTLLFISYLPMHFSIHLVRDTAELAKITNSSVKRMRLQSKQLSGVSLLLYLYYRHKLCLYICMYLQL